MPKSAIINFLDSNIHSNSAIQHSNHIDKTIFLVLMTELSNMSKNLKKSQLSRLITLCAVLTEFSDFLQETSVKYVKLKVIHN